MIHVTRETYLELGHTALPPERFGEFINRAGLYAQEQTLGRVRWSFKPLKKKGMDELAERNARGICALADLFYQFEAAVGIGGAAIVAFANEGYRETYEGGSRAGSSNAFQRRLQAALQAFFTQGQLCRRAG